MVDTIRHSQHAAVRSGRTLTSESSVYRILGAEDLITAPAHVVIRAADVFGSVRSSVYD